MNRLTEITAAQRAAGRKPLVPFLTAGFPDAATSRLLLGAVAEAGCPLVEIGVPFSDPVADGPVIQAASQRALAGGADLEGCFDLAETARGEYGLGVVLMGYLNPILKYGPRRFAERCGAAGVAGVIVPDLPLEEAAGLHGLLDQADADLVGLVAPTTDEERLRRYALTAAGFLYLVSTTGVTGSGAGGGADLADYVGRVRAATDLPLYVGFGIGTPDQAARVAAVADGAIVGSALLGTIMKHEGDDPVGAARTFIADLARAMVAEEGEGR